MGCAPCPVLAGVPVKVQEQYIPAEKKRNGAASSLLLRIMGELRADAATL